MRRTLAPCVFAACFAAAADGSFAARGVLAEGASLGAAVSAFAVATALVLGPLLCTLLVGSAVLGPLASDALREARATLARLSGGHAPLAAVLLTGGFAVATTRAAVLGRAIIAAMSPHLAATLLVVCAVALATFGLALGAALARAVGPRLARLETRAPLLRVVTRGLGARVLLAVVVCAWLDALLLREYVFAPAAGIVAALVAPAVRVALAHRSAPDHRAWRRLPVFVGAVVVVTLAAPQALARLSGRARAGVAHRPPYGSLVLAAARRLVDRDHDGYSPILGGGDCDDADPSVHPGAPDVPDNGRDENCSGADATAFVQPPGPAAARPSSLAPRPNLVLLVVDALRPDHLGFAGYARPTSPNLDRFREGATWFRRTYTPAPSTRFALGALFTGKDVEAMPQRRGHGNDFELLARADTLAEALDRIGYDRVGITIPHVALHIAGLEQGFRVFAPAVPKDTPPHEYSGKDAPPTTDAALAYLASAHADGGRPFFLFAHYECTHWPYIAHVEHDFGETLVDAYDSALAHCDAELGRVIDALDGRADRERTIVAIVSDHGELLGEHGLWQHGSSLLEPAVRSLLLVRVPGDGPRARTVDTPVMLTDLEPTLRELAGAPEHAGRTTAWRLGGMLAGAAAPGRPLFLYVDDWRAGVRYESRGVVDGRWKLARDLPTGFEELYDLDADPTESRSRARDAPEVRARLAALVDAWDPTGASW